MTEITKIVFQGNLLQFNCLLGDRMSYTRFTFYSLNKIPYWRDVISWLLVFNERCQSVPHSNTTTAEVSFWSLAVRQHKFHLPTSTAQHHKKNWKTAYRLQRVLCIWSNVRMCHNFVSCACPVSSMLTFSHRLPQISTSTISSVQQWLWLFSAKKGDSNTSSKLVLKKSQ